MGNLINPQICCIKTEKQIESVRLDNEKSEKKINVNSVKISNKSTIQNSIKKRKNKDYISNQTVKPKKIIFLDSEIRQINSKINNNKLNENDLRKQSRKLTLAPKGISMELYYKKRQLISKNYLFNQAMGKIQNLNFQTSRNQNNNFLSEIFQSKLLSRKAYSTKKTIKIKHPFEENKEKIKFKRQSMKTQKKKTNINLLGKNTENKTIEDKIETLDSPPHNKRYKVNENLTKKQMNFIREVLIDNNIVIDFDEDTINEFIIGFFSFEVEANYTLFDEGDEARVFYIIEEGEIIINEKIFDSNYNDENKKNNNELIQQIHLKRGNFFGIDSFEEGLLRSQKAYSNCYTKLLCVSGEFYRSALIYMDLKITNERVSVLKNTFLFKYLEKSQLINLSKKMLLLEYKPNSIIVSENENCDNIYIIVNGVVRKTRKFKKIDELKSGELFCHINFFINSPSYYTYSVDQNPLNVYELKYNSIREILGQTCLKEIVYNIFNYSISRSNLSEIMITEQEILFSVFKVIYYETGEIVFCKDCSKNKKFCIIIEGKLATYKNYNKILAQTGDIYGENIIDSKKNLEEEIITLNESLILEASWEDIIKVNEKKYNSINKLDLIDTVNRLKKIPIFSTLKETKYLEIAKNIQTEIFPDKSVIMKEGQIANKFYIIKSGKVKMEQQKNFIRFLELGGCFGEIPNITGEIDLFTVTAIGNVECYILTKEDFPNFDYNISKEIKEISSLNDVNINIKDLYYVKTLGNGKFGKVFLVHNMKHFYAIKNTPLIKIYQNKHLIKYYLNEKNIMLKINHPFVVKLVKTLKNKENLFFLIEYIDGISLKSYLEKKRKTELKNLQETTFYGGILLSTINYLHSKKILHRDIKPDNLMINKNGYLKIIDFGISKELKEKDITYTICGTPHYLAPEVIIGKGYSYSSDYWSVGITMFEIFYGYVPFGQSSKDIMNIYFEILNKKLNLPYEPKFNDINNFFRIILNKNLMQRVCNFNLMRSHPFFHNIDFEQLDTFSIPAPFIPNNSINLDVNNNIIQNFNVSIERYITEKNSTNSKSDFENENNRIDEKIISENQKYIDEF